MAASLLALGLDPERCTLFVQSHRPGAHRAGLAADDRDAGELARTDADLQGEEGQPAGRHQPRPAHLPGPAGRRHRHLQGVDGAGRQGPGRPPGAVARDRPGLQRPLRRDVPGAEGGLHRGARRPGHGRRQEDEQVRRQHDRRVRRRGRHPQAGHVDGDRHEADPADGPGPPGGLQRLPAPALVRRRLRGPVGGRAHGPDRLRRHEEAARRADHPPLRRRPASAISNSWPTRTRSTACWRPAPIGSGRWPRRRWRRSGSGWACDDDRRPTHLAGTTSVRCAADPRGHRALLHRGRPGRLGLLLLRRRPADVLPRVAAGVRHQPGRDLDQLAHPAAAAGARDDHRLHARGDDPADPHRHRRRGAGDVDQRVRRLDPADPRGPAGDPGAVAGLARLARARQRGAGRPGGGDPGQPRQVRGVSWSRRCRRSPSRASVRSARC